jgi:hypothetical protein
MHCFVKSILEFIQHIPVPIYTSIIGAALVFLFTWLQKRKDYENEYYKKVIENRFAAYKMVEDLLATLAPDNKHPKITKPLYLVVFWVTLDYYIGIQKRNIDEPYDRDKEMSGTRDEKADNAYLFNLFSRNLADTLRQEVWLSDALLEKLSELFKVFITISFEYDELYLKKSQESKKDALTEVGHLHHDEVVNLREEIKIIFYSDMNSLHEVAQFLKSKKKRYFSIN